MFRVFIVNSLLIMDEIHFIQKAELIDQSAKYQHL